MKRKSITYPLRLPPDLYQEAKEVGAKEGRPVANLLRRALTVYIERARAAEGVQDAQARAA